MTSKFLISAILGITTIALVQPATMTIAQTTNGGATAEQFLSTGVSKYNSGDKQGALADYNQAIQLNADYALAYVNRAVVRSTLGDRQGAIADLDRAISFA
jgi:tetratricopeptide (TPR) repeat protein